MKSPAQRRRGSATVFALLVSLLLMVLVSGTMALTIVDTETVNDYTRNRDSFQASDSGVQHGRTQLASALSNWHLSPATTLDDLEDYREDATSGVTANDKDISLIKDTADNIAQVLPRNTAVTSQTWSGGGTGPDGRYDVTYNVTPTGVTEPVDGDISARQIFHYNYEIASRGNMEIGGQDNISTRRETGSFDVEVERPSFATYGYFTDSLKNQFNQQLWFYDGEVYDGPTHVNAAPPGGQAAFWGQATFNGAFTAVQEAYEDSVLAGGANPQFNAGATWGVDQIDVPTNGWSQLRASVGDLDNIENQTAPTNAELRQSLGLTVSADPVPPGVYVSPNSNAGSDPLGGIFVNGDANYVQLTQSGSEQIITINMTAASGPYAGTHTWTIRDNQSTDSATISYDGGTPMTLNSSLNGVVHVEGKVKALKGSNSSTADINKDHQVTISATGNVFVADHITYEEDPASFPGTDNILGIFSSGGNVMLAKTAPANLNLHATVMAASPDHGVGAEDITTSAGSYDYNYGNKGNWNLLGGLIEDKNQTTGVFYSDGTMTGYRWNFTYDDRFTEGVAPPYFPYVSKFVVEMQGIQPGSWSRKYF
jgi:hypothetical protein